MRRATAYIIFLGMLTGFVIGIAAFGLPLPAAETGDAPRPLTAFILSLGLGLGDAAVAAGAVAIALLLLVAILDLRRLARRRRI